MLNVVFGQTDKQPLSIGDNYGGGIIFSLYPSGNHGLIAAPCDQPENTCWGNDRWIGAAFVGDGAANTEIIVKFMKANRDPDKMLPAACACDTLILGGYSDWFLPSINELKEMYTYQGVIGKFMSGYYCSSTEFDKANCWSVDFSPNYKFKMRQTAKAAKSYYVRCIRKF